MLEQFPKLLRMAVARGAAVGAFTAYNLETAAAVLKAAERRDVGVILLIAKNAFAGRHGEFLLAALRAAAERATVPVCVQLDHVSDLQTMERAFELGAGAAMADGSRLPFAANVAWTAQAARLAGRYGAFIEAELGGIEGDEDVAARVAAGSLTDPNEAGIFAQRSGLACLAVSIGNVHGTYRDAPWLDWDRLAAIRAGCDVPLSLHGASGLSPEDVRRSIRAGIAKVNVNTELRQRYLTATAERLEAATDGARVLDLNAAQVSALVPIVDRKLDAFEPMTAEAPSPRSATSR